MVLISLLQFPAFSWGLIRIYTALCIHVANPDLFYGSLISLWPVILKQTSWKTVDFGYGVTLSRPKAASWPGCDWRGGYNIQRFYLALCWQNLSLWDRLDVEFLWVSFCRLGKAHSPSPRASAFSGSFLHEVCPSAAVPSAVSPHVSSLTLRSFCGKHGNI